MDKLLCSILYRLADGKRIRLEVTGEVRELLEQSDRQIRSQRRQDRRHLDNAEYIDGKTEALLMNPPHEDTANLVIRMGRYHQLYVAIDKLPGMQRRRLLLRYRDGMTYRRIAELEKVSHTAVVCSVERALHALRKNLAH